MEGALCVHAGFTAARCSQAQQHAGEVKAAWEFESIVMLAAASQREGAAFQPWELAFCVFSVSTFSLSEFGFNYIGSCCSYSSEERSKPL